MILPDNYKNIFQCINASGSTATIYSSEDGTKAYKIYTQKFKYDEKKFNALKNAQHPNYLMPIDTLSLESNLTNFIGYETNLDRGIALSQILDESIDALVEAATDVPETLAHLNDHNMIIIDPNVDNIIFSDTFKFVDTYSFALAEKFSKELIKRRNLLKVNEMMLCGLINMSYREIVTRYLQKTNPKAYELFLKTLETQKETGNFVPDILSIIQEATEENSLQKAKEKITLTLNI